MVEKKPHHTTVTDAFSRRPPYLSIFRLYEYAKLVLPFTLYMMNVDDSHWQYICDSSFPYTSCCDLQGQHFVDQCKVYEGQYIVESSHSLLVASSHTSLATAPQFPIYSTVLETFYAKRSRSANLHISKAASPELL